MVKKIIGFMLVALFLAGCNDEKTTQATQSVDEFKPFELGEKVTLTSVMGNSVTLVRTEKGFKIDDSDKVLMLDIFGTYCPPCRDEAPHLMGFQLKNSDELMIVGLIHFEDVSDEYIIDSFAKQYNAYYFIANSNANPNARIVEQVLKDINYQHALSIPFKLVYKDGVVQDLTNNERPNSPMRNYYIGALDINLLENDFDRITSGD
ncbi:MAG: TlpA family protein disulfide reductase [Campylobacter sp.]|nr:TlpA family protein disulfide reductase [Campylobacter sp.]